VLVELANIFVISLTKVGSNNVGLAKLFVSNINTLIIDEPTNYLDTEAVEALLKEYGNISNMNHKKSETKLRIHG
jgi:ABC-type cobalamin/Fe3+-siderophores transport system ATPase subunit